MILVDSNIVIYSAKPELRNLRENLIKQQAVFSDLSRPEVLGYHQLTEADRTYFELLFSEMIVLPVDRDIIDRAIEIRKSYRTKTADAIIAATAMKLNCSLLTANHNDFKKIGSLSVIGLESVI